VLVSNSIINNVAMAIKQIVEEHLLLSLSLYKLPFPGVSEN
jgi:hypothetical protein